MDVLKTTVSMERNSFAMYWLTSYMSQEQFQALSIQQWTNQNNSLFSWNVYSTALLSNTVATDTRAIKLK